MTEVISTQINKSICIKCNKLQSNNGIRKGICSNCRLWIRIENSPLIDCECGHPDCHEKVHSIGLHKGKKRLATGHYYFTDDFQNKYDKIRGENNIKWKGGRIKQKDGYWYYLVPDHPYRNCDDRVAGHRLVYEHYLKILFDEDMYIPKNIEVDHIDENKENNALINLRPLTKSEHQRMHKLIDHTNTRCSDPKCKHPDKTQLDKREGGRFGRPNWYNDGNGGKWCSTCYRRNKATPKRRYCIRST